MDKTIILILFESLLPIDKDLKPQICIAEKKRCHFGADLRVY